MGPSGNTKEALLNCFWVEHAAMIVEKVPLRKGLRDGKLDGQHMGIDGAMVSRIGSDKYIQNLDQASLTRHRTVMVWVWHRYPGNMERARNVQRSASFGIR